jgi:hypothetical protein
VAAWSDFKGKGKAKAVKEGEEKIMVGEDSWVARDCLWREQLGLFSSSFPLLLSLQFTLTNYATVPAHVPLPAEEAGSHLQALLKPLAARGIFI